MDDLSSSVILKIVYWFFSVGVPTALLVLALIFFAAAAVLAVCYIKKYDGLFLTSTYFY